MNYSRACAMARQRNTHFRNLKLAGEGDSCGKLFVDMRPSNTWHRVKQTRASQPFHIIFYFRH